MAFRARWREMKKDGWTYKKPTGHSVDFVYLKPGKNIKDVEGEDVFMGEEALMKYLDKIDLAALKAKKQTRRDRSKVSKPVAAEPCPVARPVDSPSIHSTIDIPHAEHPTVESAPVYDQLIPRHVRSSQRQPRHHWSALQAHQRRRYK
ncbi:hypothetical protein V7S43_001881 [Phytophthora oleae]|uniref:MBD domain-containing protein n=1 Tax=Phytophthora oleae TaxID=2107226 RepID=A0ABD3G207_9STRA